MNPVPDLFFTVTEESFVARFAIDPSRETPETVANVDVFVEVMGGETWALTVFTVDEVRRLLRTWKDSDEPGNGSYFWAVDQLIVPEPGVVAMTTAIRALIESGDIEQVGIRCEAFQ